MYYFLNPILENNTSRIFDLILLSIISLIYFAIFFVLYINEYKYFFKEIRHVSDAKKIFKNSYFDFRNETIRIDQFSEIANRLWEILMKEKKEKNEIGYLVLMVSEINFYLDTNNLNRVDDILDEVRKYFDIN